MTLDQIIDERYPNYRWESTYAGGKDICGYFPLYEKHLPKTVENFLEIGIAMGISIKMFRDYYESGSFHAINMHWGNAGVIDKRQLQRDGIVCHEGDQSDIEFLKTIDTQFDVIIDDGSHRSDHQVTTFQHMFTHNLKDGGVYIVEDLHCCLEEYWWGDITSFSQTLLSLIIGSNLTVEIKSIYNIFAIDHPTPSAETVGFFPESVKEIYLYNPSIAFIYKHGISS